ASRGGHFLQPKAQKNLPAKTRLTRCHSRHYVGARLNPSACAWDNRKSAYPETAIGDNPEPVEVCQNASTPIYYIRFFNAVPAALGAGSRQAHHRTFDDQSAHRTALGR